MSKSFSEKMATIIVRSTIVLVVCAAIAGYFLARQQTTDIIQNREVHGLIVSIDEERGKGTETIWVDSSERIYTGRRVNSFIEPGDSLFKEKGDSFYTVKKRLTDLRVKFYPRRY